MSDEKRVPRKAQNRNLSERQFADHEYSTLHGTDEEGNHVTMPVHPLVPMREAADWAKQYGITADERSHGGIHCGPNCP